MPNWCDNYIKIKGRTEEIIKCIEGMKGKKAIYKDDKDKEESLEETYTFNATVEVPKEVLEFGYAKAGYYWQKDNWGCKWDMLYESKYELDRILEKLYFEHQEDNKTSYESYLKEGDSHSKTFRYEGDESCCKGDRFRKESGISESEVFHKEEIKEVEFFVISPWSPVDEWVKALSDKHRDLKFELRFEISEEGFEGRMSFEAGEVVDEC